ncbi:SGNH/GDSL hydrolase family protein [Candidatus Sumerlaeota bacterium]|nr:SGNH/GDSL hydrolase family protein [Candidatus Sumerlaeota bacterium]
MASGHSGTESPKRTSRGKKAIFGILAAVLLLFCAEGILNIVFLGVDFQKFRTSGPRAVQFKEESHSHYDPELGWTHLPGKRIANFYGPGKNITINPQGFRGWADYKKKNSARPYRIVCLGDSFTLGYGVDDTETYPAQLESVNSKIEAVNMGQGGYSVGQDYLWFARDGAKLDCDLVIFGFILDDLTERIYAPRMANGYARPTFELADGKLMIRNQPVPERIKPGKSLVERRHLCEYLTTHSALMRLLSAIVPPGRTLAMEQLDAEKLGALLQTDMAIFRRMNADLQSKGRGLALVMLPDLTILSDARYGGYYGDVSDRLKNFASEEKIPFLDLRPAFQAAGEKMPLLFQNEEWRHYSPEGNAVVAREIDAWLKSQIDKYPR